MTIPASISSFKALVRWLIETRHDGRPYRMAKALGVSAGLPFQWRDGTVKLPTLPTLQKMSDAYGLPWVEMMRVAWPPPPPPPGRQRRKPVPIRGGPAQAHPLNSGKQTEKMPLIGSVRRALSWLYPSPFRPAWA